MVASALQLRTICVLGAIAAFGGSCAQDVLKKEGIYEADIKQFPYLVSVERNGVHICGGAIVNRQRVLTAAHCVNQKNGTLLVRAGSSIVQRGGSIHNVVKFKIDPQFMTDKVLGDIALIWVNPAFPKRFTAAALAKPDEHSPPSDKSQLCGWGLAKVPQAPPKPWRRLHCVRAQLVPPEECARADASLPPQSILCADYLGNRRAPYVADPGGPLMVRGRLWGVTSWVMLASRPLPAAPYGLFLKAVPPWHWATAAWTPQRAD